MEVNWRETRNGKELRNIDTLSWCASRVNLSHPSWSRNWAFLIKISTCLLLQSAFIYHIYCNYFFLIITLNQCLLKVIFIKSDFKVKRDPIFLCIFLIPTMWRFLLSNFIIIFLCYMILFKSRYKVFNW